MNPGAERQWFTATPADNPGVRIKVCGITNRTDALLAAECGAAALGLNFYRGSKRFVEPDAVAGWIEDLPAEIAKIAVLVDPSWEAAAAIAGLPFIDGLQLHGNEAPDFCRRLRDRGVPFSKAIPVESEASLSAVVAFHTETLVLDSRADGLFGGTGRTFPWELAARFVRANSQLRVVLAGGLTPDNVTEAISFVRPFAVDVTSGVEASPGQKDHGRLRAFVAAVRSASER